MAAEESQETGNCEGNRGGDSISRDETVLCNLLQFKKDFSLGTGSSVSSTPSTRSYSESSTCSSSSLNRDDSVKSLKEFQKSFKLCSRSQEGENLPVGTNGDKLTSREVPKLLDISSSISKTHHVRKRKRRPKTTLEDQLQDYKFTDVYELTSDILGTGAGSTVLTCTKKSTGKKYAVKIVCNTRDEVRDRVLKEVEILYNCSSSSNFLQIEDFFETNEKFYLVFEKMAGPLLELIQKRERFTEKEASLVTKEVATALEFLHKQGIAHRDLKPENILCERLDQVVPIKICDFDLSSMQSVSTTPNLFTPVGSAEFMAPEVVDTFTGEIFSYDKKCDLWSLGVLVYMMLSGHPPFYGRCSKNCGWERGEDCEDCQWNLSKVMTEIDSNREAMLLERIINGQYSFSSEIWSNISSEAKDLISRLLERDVERRLSATDVLKHPWLKKDVPDTPLQTPGVLRCNPSIPEELSQYAASCLKCTRRLSTQLEKTPFTLSPPGSSDLALRREQKCS